MIYKSECNAVSRLGLAVLIVGLLASLANAQMPPNSSAPSASPNQSVPSPEQKPSSELLIGDGPEQKPTSELVIGSGDLLEVSVFGAPEFAKTVRVSGSGDISLPLIGSVKVAGLSIVQAQALVSKRLIDGKYFRDPQVSIFEKEYATQGVSILGEVQKPGIYPLLGSRKLFDAISAAGGTTPRAGNTVTITRRDLPGKSETIPLKYGPQGSYTDNNVQVLPGDTVVVSKAGIVYVVGDVGKPGGFAMENSEMTVLQAIAMAQGTNRDAALDRARLIRRNSTQPQESAIPLKQILDGKASDFRLQPDDIVFVPNNAGKAAFRKTIEAIVQTASGIAIYRY